MSDCTIPESYDDGTTYDEGSSTDSVPSMQVDMDGDGFAETTMMDLNADGVADAYDVIDPVTGTEILVLDADGDGMADTAIVDVDGDGVFDQGVADTDGDGVIDSSFDPATGEELDTTVPFDDPSVVDETEMVEESDLDDDVHGDPMAEIPYHQAQVSSNDCLPTSVAMVLTEALGEDVPQGDVVDLANELGLLGPDGMTLEGGLQLLDHYGVEAEVETGSVDDLRAMLDAGKPVIIGLDSDDLYGVGDEPFADDLVAGHAVVITGIDDEAGLIYINDPGFPDGAGVAISIEEFEDAWADADNTMIVADVATATESTDTESVDAESADAESVEPAVESVESDDEGKGTLGRIFDLVLLPITLSV